MNVSRLVIGRQYSYKGQQVIFDESHEEDESCCGFPIYVFSNLGTNGKVFELCTDQVIRDIQEIPRKHVADTKNIRKEAPALVE